MKMTTGFLLSVLFLFLSFNICPAGEPVIIPVYNAPGEYLSPDGSCSAVLEIGGMGGFLILQAGGRNHPRVDDVNGIAWVDNDLLVYTVSPIYGKPGLYLFDCSNGVTAQLLPPHNSDYAYPDGKDYFELTGVEKHGPVAIRYYYSPDVSKTDFNAFRVRENLKTYILDMTGGPALVRPR